MFQTLRGKQKYQVTNVGVEKIKLSRLLVQRINEFKINEIQHKTQHLVLKLSRQTVIVSYFWALNYHVTYRQQKTYLQSCITLCTT